MSPCSRTILGHARPQNDCARRQVCLRYPATGLRLPRHATMQRVMATTMPLRLSLFPHVAYTCAIAYMPTIQGNLGYPGVPATARFRVALPGGRRCGVQSGSSKMRVTLLFASVYPCLRYWPCVPETRECRPDHAPQPVWQCF